MPANLFLKLEGSIAADGESLVKGHEKQIEIHSYAWGVSAESTWTKGGGASVGKPNPGKLTVTKNFDSASPPILKYLVTGKAFTKATIMATKTTGQGTPQTYLTITLEGVYVTSVDDASTGDSVATQTISFAYKTIGFDYHAQNAKDGTLAGSIVAHWDIPAGTVA